eukprot:TRINITY_DN4556_c0_g1_i1.p1 TRINITY_DN4556_c0_g1~~TRINITY_DN4556_c0_g1_i1.p1  ORF type:complete len:365 (+),score=83.34 TRINITY_DN4556_c0_g1_i1:27-1121(+)
MGSSVSSSPAQASRVASDKSSSIHKNATELPKPDEKHNSEGVCGKLEKLNLSEAYSDSLSNARSFASEWFIQEDFSVPDKMLNQVMDTVKDLSVKRKDVREILEKSIEATGGDLRVSLILTVINDVSYAAALGAGLMSKYGAVHAAVGIGPLLYDWDAGELCLPRARISFDHYTPFCVLYVGTIKCTDRNKILKLSQRITTWNTSHSYSVRYCDPVDAGNNKQGNCQAFAEDLLHTLGFTVNVNGAFKKYLDEVRWNPRKELAFNFKDKVVLDTHERLVRFVQKNSASFDAEDKLWLVSIDNALHMQFQEHSQCELWDLKKEVFGIEDDTQLMTVIGGLESEDRKLVAERLVIHGANNEHVSQE